MPPLPTPPGNMHLAAPSPAGHGPAYPGPVRRASPEPVHRTARTTYLTRLPARAGVARRYRACKHQSGRVPDRPLPTSTDRPYWDPGRHRGDDFAEPISPSMYALVAPATFVVSSPSRQATTATASRPSPVHGHPTRRASTGGAGSPQTTPRCSPSGMKMGFESPERLHHRTT